MKNFCNRGFTLIELSIVLIIIAVIAGAITEGANLLDVTKRSSIISDMRKYAEAYDSFKEKYRTPPGDYTGKIIGSNTYGENCTGNGDGYINYGGSNAVEKYCAWYQMAEAGFVEGNYTGQAAKSVPLGPYTNTYYTITDYVLPSTNYGNVDAIILGRYRSAGALFDGGVLKPEQAYKIDEKLDNVAPLNRRLWAFHGSDKASTTCINYTADGNYDNDTYNLSSTDEACYIIYLMDDPFIKTW